VSHYIFTFSVDSDLSPKELGGQIGSQLREVEADIEMISCEAQGVFVSLDENGDTVSMATE
jgi:hypothetical protein